MRTADGEQVVGSWQAGSPEEALAYFQRKYDGLVTEVDLLEQRVQDHRSGGQGRQAAHRPPPRSRSTRRTRSATWTRSRKRLDELTERSSARREERKAPPGARRGPRGQGALVAEAERLRRATHWKAAGERLRALVEELEGRRGSTGPPRRAVAALLARPLGVLQAAQGVLRHAGRAARGGPRDQGEAGRRGRGAVRAPPTGARPPPRYRELMARLEGRGPRQRDAEDDLWTRFRGAQDMFFQAARRVFAERDAEQQENLEPKEELAAEAETLLPVTRPEARARPSRVDPGALGGHRPCPAGRPRDGRGPAAPVERAIREAEEAEWRRTNPEARARAGG